MMTKNLISTAKWGGMFLAYNAIFFLVGYLFLALFNGLDMSTWCDSAVVLLQVIAPMLGFATFMTDLIDQSNN
jgi:hypothetical protein